MKMNKVWPDIYDELYQFRAGFTDSILKKSIKIKDFLLWNIS